MNTDAKRVAMIEEIEFLLTCDVGEHAILEATGYTRNPSALKRLLGRAGRLDLIPRIFQWQAEQAERMRPNQIRYQRKEAA